MLILSSLCYQVFLSVISDKEDFNIMQVVGCWCKDDNFFSSQFQLAATSFLATEIVTVFE